MKITRRLTFAFFINIPGRIEVSIPTIAGGNINRVDVSGDVPYYSITKRLNVMLTIANKD